MEALMDTNIVHTDEACRNKLDIAVLKSIAESVLLCYVVLT